MTNTLLTVAETLIKARVGGEDWNEEPLRSDILKGKNRCMKSLEINVEDGTWLPYL